MTDSRPRSHGGRSPGARSPRRPTTALVAALVLLVAGVGSLPAPARAGQGGLTIPVPEPTNEIQKRHTNFFDPATIYDFQADPVIQRHVPEGLAYELYSAVGYNLANSMMVIGPNGGVVIVDTLGDAKSAKEVAGLFLEKYETAVPESLRPEDPGKLPIEAIVYTHNHIDHTGGVQGFLDMADRPVCPPEPEAERGGDGSYLVRGDCVEVICQEKVIDAVINTATVAGQMINTRSAYMYGSFFSDPAHRGGEPFNNNGIGPFIEEGDSGFQMPSKTFGDELYLSAAGLDMQLVYVPSETDDELAIFLPDRRNRRQPSGAPEPTEEQVAEEDPWGGPGLLFSAEVLQGPAFPNLYSLRGTSYRNPANWFRSVDRLLEFDSWCMVPSHGPPLCGRENVETLLVNFRDAVQFTHDQAVRYFNLGYVPDQLAEIVRLPRYIVDNLAALSPPVENVDPKDYLRPLYGSVSQGVRELYFGYLGWFDGDPTHLHPNPPQGLAERRVEAMGGTDAVLADVDDALESCRGADDAQYAQCQCFWSASTECRVGAEECGWALDCQWAAELATEVITATQGDEGREDVFWEARRKKADAFLAIAPLATNPNWSNWYVTSSMELSEPAFAGVPSPTNGLVSPGIVAELPPGAWVNSWTMKLQAEATARQGVDRSLGIYFPAAPGVPAEGFSLEIRRAVARFAEVGGVPPEGPWNELDAVVEVSRAAFRDLLFAEKRTINHPPKEGEPSAFDKALQAALDDGGVRVVLGTAQEVKSFFHHFDQRPRTIVPVTVHPPLPERVPAAP